MKTNILGFALATALALIASGCAVLGTSSGDNKPATNNIEQKNATFNDVRPYSPESGKPLHNPNHAGAAKLSKYDFINPYHGRQAHLFGVDKADYKFVIQNADSGYAHDAFLASLAYWTGHYQQGKRNVRYGKGRSLEKSRHYMKLASDLGWPEASFMLHKCYATWVSPNWPWLAPKKKPYTQAWADIGQPKDRDIGCIHNPGDWSAYENGTAEDRQFFIKKDDRIARLYLERLAAQGHGFDPGFEAISKSKRIHPLNRLDARTNMLIAQLRHQSLAYTAAQHAIAENRRLRFSSNESDHGMFKETYESACTSEFLLALGDKASLDELMICGSSSADGRYCPGYGYDSFRVHLEACMELAPDHASWHQLYQQRVKYYHPYFDGKRYVGSERLLEDGVKRYTEVGDSKNANRIRALIKKVGKDANALSANWDAIGEQSRRTYEARRKAEKEQEAADERRRIAKRAQRKAEQAAWDAQHRQELKDWDIGGSDFATGADLDRIQDKTMQEIRAQQNRLRLSSGSSAPAPQRTQNRPRNASGGTATLPPKRDACPPPPMANFCPPPRPKPCQFCAEASVWLSEWEAHCEPKTREHEKRYQSWKSTQTQSCVSQWESSGSKKPSKGKAK